MEILDRKDSKLLGRSELKVVFPERAGVLTRKDAVKEVAQEMKVPDGRVCLLSLTPEAGSRVLVGRFHVYDSDEGMAAVQHEYLRVRLMTKEEREQFKQAKKKAGATKAK